MVLVETSRATGRRWRRPMSAAPQVIETAWRGRVDRRGEVDEVGGEGVVGLASDVALQEAEDLALILAHGAAGCVGLSAWAIAQAADGGHVQRARGGGRHGLRRSCGGGAWCTRDRAGNTKRGEAPSLWRRSMFWPAVTSNCRRDQ